MLPQEILAHYRGLADARFERLKDERGHYILRVTGQRPSGPVNVVHDWLAMCMTHREVSNWQLRVRDPYAFICIDDCSISATWHVTRPANPTAEVPCNTSRWPGNDEETFAKVMRVMKDYGIPPECVEVRDDRSKN